jgi:hypothetical protein
VNPEEGLLRERANEIKKHLYLYHGGFVASKEAKLSDRDHESSSTGSKKNCDTEWTSLTRRI